VYASPLQSITTDIDSLEQFHDLGWIQFKSDPSLLNWVNRALPRAREAVAAPENAEWLRCGGTWFVGVNLLPNDPQGRVDDSDPVCGEAVSLLEQNSGFPELGLDKAQISICYPGYPKPSASESDSAYRYRRNRDGAHIDGLLAIGPDRRRYLKQPHAYVLGIPMADFSTDASPSVIWESSHGVVRARFREIFSDIDSDRWSEIDITDDYHALRKEIFGQCPRKELQLKRGESFLVHRLALHGIAPWGNNAKAGPDGRMICYFRPQFRNLESWLSAP